MPPRAIVAAAVLGLAGCGQSRPAEPTVAVVIADPEPVPQPPPVTLLPPPPPPAFAFPPDLGALAKVVAPADPKPLASDRNGAAPKARSVPAAVVSPESIGKTDFAPPHLALPRPVTLKPVPPREGVPVEIGLESQAVPGKPKLPDAAPPTARAADVHQPPRLPILGRPQTDRASLDDPTIEPAREALVSPPVSVPLTASPFQRVTVPDPFELGEQVKSKVPPAAEPVVVPVPVNPQRPK